jgi:hypothetical protein
MSPKFQKRRALKFAGRINETQILQTQCRNICYLNYPAKALGYPAKAEGMIHWFIPAIKFQGVVDLF